LQITTNITDTNSEIIKGLRTPLLLLLSLLCRIELHSENVRVDSVSKISYQTPTNMKQSLHHIYVSEGAKHEDGCLLTSCAV
jgi:hypothetical protein